MIYAFRIRPLVRLFFAAVMVWFAFTCMNAARIVPTDKAVLLVLVGALSFLGLGVPPPAPSWGSMIGEGRESLDIAPWLAFLPALFMFLSVLSFNIVGDTLRALTDPRPGAL